MKKKKTFKKPTGWKNQYVTIGGYGLKRSAWKHRNPMDDVDNAIAQEECEE